MQNGSISGVKTESVEKDPDKVSKRVGDLVTDDFLEKVHKNVKSNQIKF